MTNTEQIDALADAYTILSSALSQVYKERMYKAPPAIVMPLINAQIHINEKINEIIRFN